MAKIKNINGTSALKCKCGTWLGHWKKHSGQSAYFCSEKTCINTSLVGAHVKKAESLDNNWYIVPLCVAHNFSVGTLEISDSVKLVSANVSNTCG